MFAERKYERGLIWVELPLGKRRRNYFRKDRRGIVRLHHEQEQTAIHCVTNSGIKRIYTAYAGLSYTGIKDTNNARNEITENHLKKNLREKLG